jgi:hypothetical protein
MRCVRIDHYRKKSGRARLTCVPVDAIEAGLVKTPHVVVRDGILPNAATLRPKLYHLYREPEVGDDLNRRVPMVATQAKKEMSGLDGHPVFWLW